MSWSEKKARVPRVVIERSAVGSLGELSFFVVQEDEFFLDVFNRQFSRMIAKYFARNATADELLEQIILRLEAQLSAPSSAIA